MFFWEIYVCMDFMMEMVTKDNLIAHFGNKQTRATERKMTHQPKKNLSI